MTGDDLANLRRRIERAVADGAPQQLKRLLDSVVDQIPVESRDCIQPYFVTPTVRTNYGIPSASLWITTGEWGRVR